MEHTPWSVRKSTYNEDYAITAEIDGTTRVIAEFYHGVGMATKLDAESLANSTVQAVNAHDKLVEALEEAVDTICLLCRIVNPQHAECPSCEEIEIYRTAYKLARQ